MSPDCKSGTLETPLVRFQPGALITYKNYLSELFYNSDFFIYKRGDIMKKILSILLAVTMVVVSLTGCGDKSTSYFDDAEKILKDDQKAYEVSMDVDSEDLVTFPRSYK